MVAINPEMIAKFAKVALGSLKGAQGQQGGNGQNGSIQSIFGALSESAGGVQIANGGILGKLGISNIGDLKAGIDLLKEDPNGTSQCIAQDLGLGEGSAEKIASLAKKFLA